MHPAMIRKPTSKSKYKPRRMLVLAVLLSALLLCSVLASAAGHERISGALFAGGIVLFALLLLQNEIGRKEMLAKQNDPAGSDAQIATSKVIKGEDRLLGWAVLVVLALIGSGIYWIGFTFVYAQSSVDESQPVYTSQTSAISPYARGAHCDGDVSRWV